MQITEIKKVGKGLRYSVYVDENYEGTFEAEIMVKFALKTGQKISRDELDKIKIANGDLAAFDRALGVLEKGPKTQKLITDYLKGKGYPDECIDRALDKLLDYNLINDESYAEQYINSYAQSKGAKKLKYDLLHKGVAPEIIEQKLNELVSDEDQFNSCLRHAEKYVKNKELDQKTKQKLFAHLVSKGYDFSVANSVIREVFNARD